ncbi:hypothetical protein LTR95_017222, partial [Oleoguttula sp. CCFEE 5521]
LQHRADNITGYIATPSPLHWTAKLIHLKVSEFAPPRVQRYLSFLTGWLAIAGWQGGITGIGMLVATVIQGLITLNYPDYVARGWHGTLIATGIVGLCAGFNTFGARQLALVEASLALLHFGGLFVIVIILWHVYSAHSPMEQASGIRPSQPTIWLTTLAPRTDPYSAFFHINNGGGRASDGLSLLVGLYPLTVSLNGFDSRVHMSEETKDATRAIPRAIMWSTYINGFRGFIMAITMIFTLGDLDEILMTPTGYPFIQVFFNAIKSHVGITLMTVLILLPLIGSVVACVATASRQIWSFARDEGVSFSSTVRYVPRRWSIPINAILVSVVICILLSLINIGSAVALNAILALGTGSILATYLLCISCITAKRLRGETLPPRNWYELQILMVIEPTLTISRSLGRWGLLINITALCWLVPIFVFIQFPGVTPTTAKSMNSSSLLIGFVVIFATICYGVKGRKVYVSPKERLHRVE